MCVMVLVMTMAYLAMAVAKAQISSCANLMTSVIVIGIIVTMKNTVMMVRTKVVHAKQGTLVVHNFTDLGRSFNQ
jgi:carbon starvation protein CstA